MNRERNRWLAIGLLVTSLAGVVMGVVTLSGFGSAPGGDLIVPSTAGTTNLLLALGALFLLRLEFAQTRGRRPSQARRLTSAPGAIRV